MKVRFPTGGSISYVWQNSQYRCTYDTSSQVGRQVTSRSMDANDGTGAHTWNYAWATNGTSATVTDPLGNDTVNTITGLGNTCSLFVTESQIYQGSHSGGTLLKTVTTNYAYGENPYVLPRAIVVSYAVPTQATESWPNDSGFTFGNPDYYITNVCSTCTVDHSTRKAIW